jgi:hypothetical protein
MQFDSRLDRRRFLKFATAGAVMPRLARARPWQPGSLKLADGGLLFHGQPFPVRGIVYQPTPVGQDPSQSSDPFTAYSDRRIRARDFPLLRKLGANVLRLYSPREVLPEFFQDCLRAGLYVVLGFNVDTRLDLTADWARNRTIQDFRQFVRTWRGQPSVIMWAIGNGVNAELRRDKREKELKAWHSLADALAKAAHEEERDQGRPVALVSSEIGDIGVPALGSDDAAMPNVDLWGVNAFRGPSFGSLFDDLKTEKPVLLTEYGLDVGRQGNIAELDENPRAHAMVNLWHEIAARPDRAVGGCLFEFTDEWWRAPEGRPVWHEWGGARGGYRPDGIVNVEWYGLYSAAPSAGGLDLLKPRRAVQYLANAWEPVFTIGQASVWFDAPLDRDRVDARQRVSGRYTGLKPGWEIFVVVRQRGSQTVFIQPQSCAVRAESGSWSAEAVLGPPRLIGPAGPGTAPDLRLELSAIVARTPEAAEALRNAARGTTRILPTEGIIESRRLESISVRRR